MRTLAFVALAAAAICGASAQPPHRPGMHMGAILFLGQATGDQVVPRQASAATATAAIIIDPAQRQLRFDITFTGLERGAATRIGLYDFGAGGNGPAIVLLCGGGEAPACPALTSARLAGTTSTLRWSGQTLSDFASGRVYIQIDSGDGRPEIRGQLGPNGAMVPVRNYVARLAPRPESGATGEGTAVLSETYLPGERVAVEYSVTVAGTSGRPEEIALSGVAPSGILPSASFSRASRLPNARRVATRNGGTFSGSYVVGRGDRSALTADRLMVAQQAPALTVRTSRFPRGELVGIFVPVE